MRYIIHYHNAGELREYVVEELNVRALETCDQPLQYAQLRAEPDWKVPLLLPLLAWCVPPDVMCQHHHCVHLQFLRQLARGWPSRWARA
jgi:hypothetical protein